MVLAPVVALYRYSLIPVAPFSWFGVGTCTLDLVAMVRLCIALKQMRVYLHERYVRHKAGAAAVSGDKAMGIEDRSFVREAFAVLLTVYGGEAIICES